MTCEHWQIVIKTIGISIMRDLMQKRMEEQKARMINPVLPGGMATQPQLGTAMGIANQIYGMQQ